jgi:uncharacterized protein YqgC (DUF456 family)
METLLLGAILLVSMVLIPLGLPGIWLMVAAGLGFQLLVPGTVGTITVVGTAVLATIAEVIEFTLAGRYARKYGGSRRAGWGAMLGGIVGAFMGVPVPIVGPVIGAFLGAFAGAFAMELTVRESRTGDATRVAWGAMVGRVVAAGMKMGFGVMIAAWILADAWL